MRLSRQNSYLGQLPPVIDWSVTRCAGYRDGFCDRGARFAGALRPQKQYGLLGTGAGLGGGERMRPGPPPCSHSSEF